MRLHVYALLLVACDPTAPDGAPIENEGAAASDASIVDAADSEVSRCSVDPQTVVCTYRVTTLAAGEIERDVYWQTPAAPSPSGGHPLVVLFQGSLFAPSTTWGEVPRGLPFGGYYQAKLQAELLDHGFTVVAPSAAFGVAWQTNSGLDWALTTDRRFVDALLEAVRQGEFGPADTSRLYATGISSGGYMTSRMAVSYRGVFRALAVNSGSYATCVGPLCSVPDELPLDHPPTLFLHGRLDTTVPLFTMQRYRDRLDAQGIETDALIDPLASHRWLSSAPEAIVAWFENH